MSGWLRRALARAPRRADSRSPWAARRHSRAAFSIAVPTLRKRARDAPSGVANAAEIRSDFARVSAGAIARCRRAARSQQMPEFWACTKRVLSLHRAAQAPPRAPLGRLTDARFGIAMCRLIPKSASCRQRNCIRRHSLLCNRRRLHVSRVARSFRARCPCGRCLEMRSSSRNQDGGEVMRIIAKVFAMTACMLMIGAPSAIAAERERRARRDAGDWWSS